MLPSLQQPTADPLSARQANALQPSVVTVNDKSALMQDVWKQLGGACKLSFDPRALRSVGQQRRLLDSIQRINPDFVLIQAYSAPTDAAPHSYTRALRFLLGIAHVEIDANRQVIFTGSPRERFWTHPDVVEFFQARPQLRTVEWHWCSLRLHAGTQVHTPASGITRISGMLSDVFLNRPCDSEVHLRDTSVDRDAAH